MNDNIRKIINLHEKIDFNTEVRYSTAMKALDDNAGLLVESITKIPSGGTTDLNEQAEKISNAHKKFKTAIERNVLLYSVKSIESLDFKAGNQALTQNTEIIYDIVSKLSKTQQRIEKITKKGQSSLSEEDASKIEAMINSCAKSINDSIPGQGSERLRKSSGELSL